MYIDKLNLKDFRNYKELNIDFSSGVNILTGDNAQGKTNVLESLFFCAFGRSHRTSRDQEMLSFGSDSTKISVNVKTSRLDKNIVIKFLQGKKYIEINGRKILKIQELLGNLKVVMFSPEDLKVVKESPGVRRRFLDMEICALDSIYYHNLVSYNKILQERNNLFKMRIPDKSILDVYDEKLAHNGSIVIEKRIEYLRRLNESSRKIHGAITSDKEKLEFNYKSSISLNRDLKGSMMDALKRNYSNDVEKFTTSVGPHRDDFAIMLNGSDSRHFGSQGQQRTAILTLKFASLDIIKELTGEYPVLLLDDVLSELDLSRQNYILSSIEGIQTIITMTGYENIEKRILDNSKLFIVEKGTISQKEVG